VKTQIIPQNGVWYQSPGNQGWGTNRTRKSSVIDADNLPSSSLKPSAGRVIRIINNNDHSVQVSFHSSLLAFVCSSRFLIFMFYCGVLQH